MSVRVAAAIAYLLALRSLLVGLTMLPRLGHLSGMARLSFAWLLCAGIAFAIGAYGVARGRAYGSRLLVAVCGLWTTIRLSDVIRHLISRSHWPLASWVVIGLEVTGCLAILRLVWQQSDRPGSVHSRAGPANAA